MLNAEKLWLIVRGYDEQEEELYQLQRISEWCKGWIYSECVTPWWFICNTTSSNTVGPLDKIAVNCANDGDCTISMGLFQLFSGRTFSYFLEMN